jgi:hypothetical protein
LNTFVSLYVFLCSAPLYHFFYKKMNGSARWNNRARKEKTVEQV